MDLQLIETGNGGDLVLKGQIVSLETLKNAPPRVNDLVLIYGFENMIYIGLFGGNVAQSTPETRAPNEQCFDWWGNTLLMPNLPTQQFNSETERALNSYSLTSGNLIFIQNAVNADLEFMQPFAKVTVNVAIIGVDKVRLQILVKEPGNITDKEFLYIWDGTKQDLIGSPNYQAPPNPPAPQEDGLQYVLQFKL